MIVLYNDPFSCSSLYTPSKKQHNYIWGFGAQGGDSMTEGRACRKASMLQEMREN
jgi:hypothetical protein